MARGRNKRKLPLTKQITLGAMVAALTILCLYAAASLPTGRLAFYFLSSLFIYVLCCEGAFAMAGVCFLAVSLLSFFLLPDKLAFVVYTLLLGHYGIFRAFLEMRVRGRVIRTLIKLLYCDVFTLAGLYLATALFSYDLPGMMPNWLPVWGLVLLVQAVFILADLLYALCVRFYETQLRSALVPRR